VGKEELVQGIRFIDKPEKAHFERGSQDGHEEWHHQEPHPKTARAVEDIAHQREEEEGAVHIERPVGKVQHPQDTKDQRQAGGNQVDRHSDRHAVQKLHEEVRHPYSSAWSLVTTILNSSSSGPLGVSVRLPPWYGGPLALRHAPHPSDA